jgi:hypothetical protein
MNGSILENIAFTVVKEIVSKDLQKNKDIRKVITYSKPIIEFCNTVVTALSEYNAEEISSSENVVD